MSQFVLYILGTIGTAVLTTIVGQLTTRLVPVSGASKPNQAAAGSAPYAAGTPVPPAAPYGASSPVPGSPYGGAGAPVPVAPVRGRAVNIGAVIMQAGILQLIVNLIAFVFFFIVGGILGASGLGNSSALALVAELLWFVIGTTLLAIAFYIIGVRVDRVVRWRHLIYLAVGTTILTIVVNAVLEALFYQMQPTIYSICGSAFQAFLAMGIGGAFASRAKGSAASPTPAAVLAAPYGYGAPALGSVPLYPGPPAPGSMSMYPPQSMPPYPQAAPGSMPMYPPPPGAGWNAGQGPSPTAPSVYPSAWPYPPLAAGGQTPGSVPPTNPGQQPPPTQPPSGGTR